MSVRMYAIYDHPKDYPGHWVVRGWEILSGTWIDARDPIPDMEAILCDSIEEARRHIAKLAPGAVLVDRYDPDPNISEVWM